MWIKAECPRLVRKSTRLAASCSSHGIWREIVTYFLLLVDLSSSFGDAAFYKISLNLEFLLRAQVHRGVKR